MGIILRIILGFVFAFISNFAFDLTILESLSVGFSVYILVDFVTRFGKSINLILDSIIILACLTWLITPLFFYHFYNENNELAVLWVKSMPISSDIYYSFVFPGVVSLWLGLKLKSSNAFQSNFKLSIFKQKFEQHNFKKIAIVLISLSIFASAIRPFAPSSLIYILFLFVKLIFVGLSYLYFSEYKPNLKYLALGFALMLFTSIQQGMFGEMVFMLLIGAIIFTTSYNIKLRVKILVVLVGLFFILLIQSIKYDYRKVAWTKGGDSSYFFELIGERISDPGKIIEGNKLFFIAVRFNQGWLIASTMARVPSVVPFANGETILNSLAAIAIPRFLWPNKPEAGGKYNIEHFLGYKDLPYSMNIGPIGEAYANFGKWGGIFFMFVYGLFIRFIFDRILIIIEKRPTVIIWLPLLFFYAVGVETDILTTLNSLIKTCVFVYFLYWIFPKVSKISL